MSEFIGTLKNKTTGQIQNVTDRDAIPEGDVALTIMVEGDSRWHSYSKEEYDFIPARKTFQEQFDDLAIGDVFTVDGFTGYRVKVDEERYYNSNVPYALIHTENVDSGEDITKKED